MRVTREMQIVLVLPLFQRLLQLHSEILQEGME